MKIVILLLITQLSFAFNLVGSSIATYADPTIFVHVGDHQCPTFSDTPEQLMNYVQKAADQYWNRISTSSLELRAGSIKNVDSTFYTNEICSTGGTCIPKVDTGVLIVCNDNGTTFSTAGKLAVALPNNVNGSIIVGSVVAINAISSSKFNSLTEQEKVSVIAHEIGHTFGLGHSKFQDSLMYSKSYEARKGLGRDDWDGASYLYPKEQGPAGLCGTIETDSNSNDKGKLIGSLLLLLSITVGYYTKSNKFS